MTPTPRSTEGIFLCSDLASRGKPGYFCPQLEVLCTISRQMAVNITLDNDGPPSAPTRIRSLELENMEGDQATIFKARLIQD
jgi:hypothetical protein